MMNTAATWTTSASTIHPGTGVFGIIQHSDGTKLHPCISGRWDRLFRPRIAPLTKFFTFDYDCSSRLAPPQPSTKPGSSTFRIAPSGLGRENRLDELPVIPSGSRHFTLTLRPHVTMRRFSAQDSSGPAKRAARVCLLSQQKSLVEGAETAIQGGGISAFSGSRDEFCSTGFTPV